MLISGYSPMMAGSVGVILFVIVSQFSKNFKMGLMDILAAFEEGATNTVIVSVACAIAGIVVGVITNTGLGIRFSSLILAIAGENMFIVLILTAIASVILGMGMTAAAVYVIVSALTVPALIDIGVMEMPAHFYVYYYGIASAITPPVALAAYGAAGIAGANNNRTAFTAIKLAIVTFLVPIAFVYNPSLMGIGSIQGIVFSVISAFLGVFGLSVGLSSCLFDKMCRWKQLLFIISGVALLYHIIWVNILGFMILLLMLFKVTYEQKEFEWKGGKYEA